MFLRTNGLILPPWNSPYEKRRSKTFVWEHRPIVSVLSLLFFAKCYIKGLHCAGPVSKFHPNSNQSIHAPIQMPSTSTLSTLRASIHALPPAVRTAFLENLFDKNKTLSSFSAAKWSDFFIEHGTEFGFQHQPFEYSNFRMENDITPTYKLPWSFHKEVCKDAMIWLSVYPFKRQDRTKGGVHLRLLEPVR